MTDPTWAMTRVATGDYLLPSNDAKTLWRLQKYEERDGTLTRGDGTVVNGDFWAVLRYLGPVDCIAPGALDDPTRWECVCSMLATRKDAIAEAMSYEPGASCSQEEHP